MAIQSTLVKSALSLKYKEGVDTNGNDIIKARKFSNVKVFATDESIFATAEAFKPLMKYPVLEVQRTNDNVITTA